MNKKLAVLLVMVVTFLPASVLAASPLSKYNLYDDVMGGGNPANRNTDSAMGEYYNNSLRPGSKQGANDNSGNSSAIAASKEGIQKYNEINAKINNLMKNKNVSDREKLVRLKSYNNDLKAVVERYFKEDPDYNTIKQVLDENENFYNSLAEGKMNQDQRVQAIEKHQESVANTMKSLSNAASVGSALSSYDLDSSQLQALGTAGAIEGRNEYLRESSKKTYADNKTKERWLEGPVFYETPSIYSIIVKYRMSNFAGAMQESEAYVRKNPKDTLGYYYLAMSYAKINDKENAIKAYEKVISLHDNPMIVKYATNGRNCIMGRGDEAKCYQDVNVPELKYPYAEMAANMDMTIINPQDLVNKNFAELQGKLGTAAQEVSDQAAKLPFGPQDAKLDEFINAPYGNGFSEELNEEYKQLQLRQLKQSINSDQTGPENYVRNFNNIKKFDNNKY